jgi:hypothetical protein
MKTMPFGKAMKLFVLYRTSTCGEFGVYLIFGIKRSLKVCRALKSSTTVEASSSRNSYRQNTVEGIWLAANRVEDFAGVSMRHH